MKAWQFDPARPDSRLFTSEVESPQPGPGEVCIRVYAAGVTPSELQWYPTTHTNSGQVRANAIPGHEFSGVVTAVGAGVNLAPGQEVFGMNDWFADGATAEFCRTVPSTITSKPGRLTHVEAASIPIAALTAWQGLFIRAKLQPGERVLIHGGAGAVGVLAIQLARWRGARVLTTASARNREVLVQLGADQVIDYHTERFEDVARGVDVVFDGVGGETLQRSRDMLTPSSRLVTIAASSETTTDEQLKQAFFIVEPDAGQLQEIVGLLDSGHLRPVIDSVVPFEQAALAYANLATRKRGYGKMVVAVIPPD
jgi:NADPH:quinone reductase-like Zn-dependent oxidoreductase